MSSCRLRSGDDLVGDLLAARRRRTRGPRGPARRAPRAPCRRPRGAPGRCRRRRRRGRSARARPRRCRRSFSSISRMPWTRSPLRSWNPDCMHPAQGRVQVAVVEQVVGDLLEDGVGVELEPDLGAVPPRVPEPTGHHREAMPPHRFLRADSSGSRAERGGKSDAFGGWRRTTPRSVMRAVTSSAGVMSNAGLAAGVAAGDDLDRVDAARRRGADHGADLVGRPLLDRDRRPVGAGPVDGAARRGDEERHAVGPGRERLQVGADLVGDVAVGGDAVGAGDHHVDLARGEQVPGGAVGHQPVRRRRGRPAPTR